MKQFAVILGLCVTLILTSALMPQPSAQAMPPCASMEDVRKHGQKLKNKVQRAQIILHACLAAGMGSCAQEDQNVTIAFSLFEQFNAFDWKAYFENCRQS